MASRISLARVLIVTLTADFFIHRELSWNDRPFRFREQRIAATKMPRNVVSPICHETGRLLSCRETK